MSLIVKPLIIRGVTLPAKLQWESLRITINHDATETIAEKLNQTTSAWFIFYYCQTSPLVFYCHAFRALARALAGVLCQYFNSEVWLSKQSKTIFKTWSLPL